MPTLKRRSRHSAECNWLHRLPAPNLQLPDTSLDIFGREKHAQYRDDMGGVGSFTRQNRTLYIGRMKETRDSEEVIERHFQEWGEIERRKRRFRHPPFSPDVKAAQSGFCTAGASLL